MTEQDEWKGSITLEQWMERAIGEGHNQIVIDLLKTLPEEKKQKYREIWRRLKAEKEETK